MNEKPTGPAVSGGGMTLRDLFASVAMHKLVDIEGMSSAISSGHERQVTKATALLAYALADAMIEERAKNRD